jgi:hypothetical protein
MKIKAPELEPAVGFPESMGLTDGQLIAVTTSTPVVSPVTTTTSAGDEEPQSALAKSLGITEKELKKKAKEPEKSVVDNLVMFADILWHSHGVPWATITSRGHSEHHLVEGSPLSRWVFGEWYEKTGKTASDRSMKSAVGIMAHKALRGENHNTHIRWAKKDNAIYCDLGNDKWEAIKITGDGWKIVSDPPVKFRREGEMMPFDYPERGGKMDDLRPYLHTTDHNWMMMKGFILDGVKGYGPYFILAANGVQGAAKTEACRMMRRMIDPRTTGEIYSLPKNEADLGVTAQHEHLMVFDNVSYLKPEMSDALCRCSTGGGIKTRKLYCDSEIVTLPICQPILMNGIPDFVVNPDLMSRTLTIHQPAIEDAKRKDLKEVWGDFYKVFPSAFGGMLDLISQGLRNIDSTKLSYMPRMADSTKWITACLGSEIFLDAYKVNEMEAIEGSLEDSPVAQLLKDHLKNQTNRTWEGTAEELRQQLFKIAQGKEGIVATGKILESAKSTGSALRRATPNLIKGWGMKIEYVRSHGRNLVKLILPIEG